MRSVRVAMAAALAAVAVVLAPLPALASQASPAAPTRSTRVSASALLAHLEVAPADRRHRYRSAGFAAIDLDGDGCATRAEVLRRDARPAAPGWSGCAVAGRWRSAFDGAMRADPKRLVVDHLVPAKEAWRSGAWRWSRSRQTAFGNDLGYRASLQVVTARSSASRGNRDPSRWLPRAHRCTYVKSWIAVKARWRLTVDRAEKAALRRGLASCGDRSVRRPGVPDLIALTGSRPTRPIVLPARPRVYFFGDSWTKGAVAAPGQGFPQVLGRTLGWQVELGPDNSGAGYVHTYDPAHALLPDSAARLPEIDADLIVLEGGLNDEPGRLEDLAGGVEATIATLRARSGGAPIVVVGPASPDGVAPPSLTVIDAKEAAVARRLGIHYVSPNREHWFTPENVPRLVDPVAFHPNTAGHAYYAARLAAALQRFVTTRP